MIITRTEKWSSHEIRFVEKDGEWWAVAADVASALGYAKTDNLTKRLKEKYKDTAKWSTLGGTQTVIIISEHGIYKAIMNSHKSEAEEFEDWIFNMLKALRQSSGLEGFQIFRMLDKDHQKEMMSKLNHSLKKPVRVDFIKANTIANKAVSLRYGYPKMVKKADMTPDMLVDRQNLLESAVDLMSVEDRFHLGISVSQQVYKLAANEKTDKAI